jgi:type I restriction enzyme, S subunit
MGEWRTVRLGEYVDLLTGFPFKSAEYSASGSGVRLLRGDNIGQGSLRWGNAKYWPDHLASEYSSYELTQDDVVIAMDRPWIEAGLKYASVGRDDLPCLLVQRVARLRALPGLQQRLLRYIIGGRAFTDHVLSVQTGTAVPHISGDQIREFEFELPCVREQIAIAELLGALDDKIDCNRTLARLLEDRLAALFARSGFDERRENFVKLEALLELNPQRPKPKSPVAPHIDMGALPTESALVSATSARPPKSGTRFTNSDTVMARITPCLENGKAAYIDCLAEAEVGIGSTEFIVLRPRNGIPTEFAYFLARSARFRDYAVRHMSGSSGRQRCSAEALARYELGQPEPEALEEFAEQTDISFKRMRSALNESLVLAELRDVLLPPLLSGDLRVHDAERLAGEAL